MKYNSIFVKIILLFSLCLGFAESFAQMAGDSCTITVGTGYYYDTYGWDGGYLEFFSDGQSIATIQHNQWTPATHSVKVPANKEINVFWHKATNINSSISFFICAPSGEVVYTCSGDPKEGSIFTYYFGTAPRNVSDFSITPIENHGAIISWKNPIQTINNSSLQLIDSIVLLKNGNLFRTFAMQDPGEMVDFMDTAFQRGDFYTVYAYNGEAKSLPFKTTGPSCRYKLNIASGWQCGWQGKSIKFLLDGNLIYEIPLSHNTPNRVETHYIDLPTGWINIINTGINGTYQLLDLEDREILSGPGNFPDNYLWYNGCGWNIPDSVENMSTTLDGDSITLSWNNPTQTIDGDNLSSLLKIEVRRNDELIHTITNAVSGAHLSFTERLPVDGTYQYAVQCFNEGGGGVSSLKYINIGSDWILHNHSHISDYVDTSCYISISNDENYTVGGQSTITVYASDTAKMIKVSGSSTLNNNASVRIYVGNPNENILLPSDTVCEITPWRTVTFVFDIPVGSSPQFHYEVECVNSIYEQPDSAISIVPDTNNIIYVTQDGAGLKNGSSWENATPWLNRALASADTMAVKPVIWVARGTYYGQGQIVDGTSYAFVGRSGVNVYGGFAGNEPANYNLSQRDFEQNETILDGLLMNTVVWFDNSQWDGFHIQGGVNGCNMGYHSKIRQCVVSNCIRNGMNQVYVIHDESMIDSCLITQNGGIGINAKFINISHSTISYNGSDGVNANGEITHCVICNNAGRGLFSGWSGSSCYINNCLIVNNLGTGLQMPQYTTAENLTIANNGQYGISITIESILRNCIICGNGIGSIDIPLWFHDNYEVDHCAIEGEYLYSSHDNIPLASADDLSGYHPDFVNPTQGAGNEYSGGDWHLLPTSICINRGMENLSKNKEQDLEGTVRTQQGSIDIGAYESNFTRNVVPGDVIYVKTDGTGDGSSWQNATSDLDYALETRWLHQPYTQIWVARGIYHTAGHPFYLKENMKLYGGFIGNETAEFNVDMRNPLENATVLDAQNLNRVIEQNYSFEDSTWIDGLTLTNGMAENGAGALLMRGTTLSKCRLVNNTVVGDGAVVEASHNTLLQILVDNNVGTGLSLTASNVIHSDIVQNTGSGIILSVNDVQDTCSVCNSIVWGNNESSVLFTSGLVRHNSKIGNCAIESQIVSGDNNIVLSTDNAAANGPQFVSPTNNAGIVQTTGNWHLSNSSVCVNMGNALDSYNLATDIEAQPRVQNGQPDVGALESPSITNIFYREMEVQIYAGEYYDFYGAVLTSPGWYERRWNAGEADSVVVLHLMMKQVIYVSMEGAGQKDGSSWVNALDGETATANGSTKLADALASATIGDEFWIQSGTYHACSDYDVEKSFNLNSGVSIYGGFAGTETSLSQRDTLIAPTIFSGNLQDDEDLEHYSRTIFKTNENNLGTQSIKLDNIHITNGYNHYHTGSALHIGPSYIVKMSHCRIHHNFGSAIANEGFYQGDHCTLDSNISYCDYRISYNIYGYYEGAPAFTNKSSGVGFFKNSSILFNQAPHDGAIFNLGILDIDSSFIKYNEATDGHIGAIFNSGRLSLTHTELSNNQSYQEISTVASFGLIEMHNCVLQYNQTHRKNPLYYWPRRSWAAVSNSSHVFADGVANVSHTLFAHNSQNLGGTGGCLHFNGTATVKECSFIENIGSGNSSFEQASWSWDYGGGMTIIPVFNSPSSDGGGIHVSSGETLVEDCIFDKQYGNGGSAASVKNGNLIMQRCVFTRNRSKSSVLDKGIISITNGEIQILNSLFANNQNPIYESVNTSDSKTSFTNCTMVNNSDGLCVFRNSIGDTAYVDFDNCIIIGKWDSETPCVGSDNGEECPKYSVTFKNTLFDTLRSSMQNLAEEMPNNIRYSNICIESKDTDAQVITMAEAVRLLATRTNEDLKVGYGDGQQGFEANKIFIQSNTNGLTKKSLRVRNAEQCFPDSLGNIYYCDPQFVNPTTVLGIDSTQNPLEADFRLQSTSPCINAGDTTDLNLPNDAMDLAGEMRLKQCQIDMGCYEYGTVIYDTISESICATEEEVTSLTYNENGFEILQLEEGEHFYYRKGICSPGLADTVYVLNLTVNVIHNQSENKTACESYTWTDGNGQTYTQSGNYTYSHEDANGCTQVDTLHLTINYPVHQAYNVTECESYTWSNGNGQTYTQSGDYTFPHEDANGCTQVDTLHLTINNPTHVATSITECESYTWTDGNGQTYTTSGDYTFPHEDANGRTQVDTLHLTINYPMHVATTITECESYTWTDGDGLTYTQSGNYTYSHEDANGCTQVDTLHLTINYPMHVATTITECESYTWTDGNGQTYTQSGNYTYSHEDANGCTQVDTLHLTINYPVHQAYNITECESYTWTDGDGLTYTTSGDYTFSHEDANGCTQVDTLHLTINSGWSVPLERTVCENELPIIWNGVEFTEEGRQELNLQTVNGCDSTIIMDLFVNPTTSSEFSITTLDSCYVWNNETYCASGDYVQTLQNEYGCDSIVTLHLTITVGITDYTFSNKVIVYPNPTTGIVNVRLASEVEQLGEVRFQIYDIYGKLLDVVNIPKKSTTSNTIIDLSHYASGVYLIKAMINENSIAVQRVVKN